ncbi:ribonuclease 3 precursor, putative [Entamoeba invadens IP1]|uniref:Ribonuclease 3, putative n=1 Tax=Entamoeba invadens IP1 TaxID=370355 RepID=L7FM67_ENTIV|nr:ribonuclease 3 precursor, putative [Entamoeba invadens IP1]ELP90964.1 ribonuclease 3 precursor, putative [Entamoeba invadens IP1]|eukprot:XP_004257735.1 ribonuclease 3 precursor, putative [Entamoeba invadens IP1]
MLFLIVFKILLAFEQPEETSKNLEVFPSLNPLKETLPHPEEEHGFTVVTSKKSKKKSEKSQIPIQSLPKLVHPIQEERTKHEGDVVRPKEQPKESQSDETKPTDEPTKQIQQSQDVRPKTKTSEDKPISRRKHRRSTYAVSEYQKKLKELRVKREDLYPATPSTPSQLLSGDQKEQQKNVPIKYPPDVVIHPSTIIYLENYPMCKFYQPITRKLNLMVYVEYWPGAKCDGQTCSLPKGTHKTKERFWLHGFWPQYSNNRILMCCVYPRSDIEVEEQVVDDKELLQNIRNKWMSLTLCRHLIHQWDKHGSCSSDIYVGNRGPLEYMQTALFLYDKYDLWKLLQESELKVETEKLYALSDLKKILKRSLKIEPVFECSEMTSIAEIRTCYDIYIDKFNPKMIKCPPYMFRKEERKCAKEVMFKKFPEYLLNPKTAPRNNCEF